MQSANKFVMFPSTKSDSAGDTSRMYSELPQIEDHQDEKLSPAYTELYGDYQMLQSKIRQLKLWAYSFGLLFAFCFVLLVFAFGLSPPNAKALSPSDNDLKLTPVSQMPEHLVTFNQNDLFANHSNPKSDSAWALMMPVGDGFVIVNEPEKYDLEPGKETDQGQEYDITVFHQLHCLNHIRNYLYTMIGFAQKGAQSDYVQQYLERPDPHVFHCFDYIRQGLMCNADMTVEWPRVEADGSRFAVDGWGIQHQCKNWDSVMAWMEENRFHHPWERNPEPVGR